MILNEHFEPLGNGMEIIVSDMFHFWTDTILLAEFSKPRKNSRAVDLGAGCGTISLLWARDNPSAEITAVELQPQACDMARRSIAHNKVENIKVVNRDLNELRGVLPFGCYDLAACNPPYKELGSGVRSPDSEKLIARHEESCTIDDITLAAKNLLQFGGRFCLCQRPERLTDVLTSMRKNDLEPKRLRFVQQRASKSPKLFLIEGRRGGRPGGLITEPTLMIEENGSLSREMRRIYGSYKEGYDE